MAELKAEGALKFEADGEEIVLTEADLLIDMAQMDGFVSEADGGVTVVIDTNLSEELLEEGFVREIVSKVQTMRKEAGFEVMDHIYVYADKNEKIEDLIKKYAEARRQMTSSQQMRMPSSATLWQQRSLPVQLMVTLRSGTSTARR